jgi:hypothetical protein
MHPRATVSVELPRHLAATDRVVVAGAMLAGLLSWVCFTPLADAWWYRDDFWLLTLSRHVDSPLAFWIEDHSASFFFRPLTMTLWWASTQLFGTDPFQHYVLNAILHWGVAVAFGAWMRALARNSWVGAIAMAFYAAHPVAIRTSEWLSDRFDLLATGSIFVACTLSLCAWSSGWRRACLCLAAACACLSKESGFLVLPLVFAHWVSEAVASDAEPARAKADALCVAAVVLLVAVMRVWIMSAHGAAPIDVGLLGGIANGVWAFVIAFPMAMLGQFDANSNPGRAAPWLAILALALATAHAFSRHDSAVLSRRTLPIAITLMLSAAFLHGPIAAQNLSGNALLNDPTAARLFHATLAVGFLVILGPCDAIVRRGGGDRTEPGGYWS